MKVKRIQFRVFSAEVIEHVLVGSSEVIDVWFSEGRTRELNVCTSAVGRHVEAMPFEEEVCLHASVLIRRTHHSVPKFHSHKRKIQRKEMKFIYLLFFFFICECSV